MAKVKGPALQSTLAFLSEHISGGLDAVLEKLDQEDQDFYNTPVMSSDWYEIKRLWTVMEAAKPLYPGQKDSFYRELGRFSADAGLKGVYRLFLRIAVPSYIIKKAPMVWRSYYDSGSMHVVDLDKMSCKMALRDFDEPSSALCERFAGWMERTLELCGATDMLIEHTECVNQGGRQCLWNASWN